MRIFVANLPWTTTEDDLARLFEPYGSVSRAQIATGFPIVITEFWSLRNAEGH